jgi:Leucine-rich repeat (LRR) protein
MKKYLLIIFFAFANLLSQAQCDTEAYNMLMKQSNAFAANMQYENAVKKYSAAIIACPDKASIAQQSIVQVFKKIEKLKNDAEKAKAEADSLRLIAEAEKEKAKKALARAEQMQKKVETAMFDKAIKEHNKEWKGYANMCWDGILTDEAEEILKEIDSLNLSNNALLRLPKEIADCPKLKHINLLGNKDIDWQDCFTKVKITGINSFYVSVNDLSDIDSTYWHYVTGIEILKNELTEIPENILQQKQLTYLDLTWNQLGSLPTEIGKLTNLTWLDLRGNNFSIKEKQKIEQLLPNCEIDW